MSKNTATISHQQKVIYSCQPCSYTTDNKTDYERHLTRNKHIVRCSHQNELSASNEFYCQQCHKVFKCRTSIYKHKAICKGETNTKTTTAANTTIPGNDHNLCEALAKNFTNAMMLLFQQNTEFQSKMMEMCKNGGISNSHNTNSLNTTNNNQQYSLNFFLNEKCKDAMNMKDFVNSIQLNMTDMENMDRLGYVEGMSTIFINNLNKTDVYKRPVLCSDMKRETLYVKENDQWEREGPDHAKMTKAVLAVEHKNVVLVNEWANANPRCLNSNTRENEKYFRLSNIVTDGDKEGNIAKVIRKVAKRVGIEKPAIASVEE